MRHTFLALLIAVLLGGAAADVGVVVELPDGTVYTECVDVSDGSSAYSVMQKTDLDLEWSEEGQYGRMLCMINGVGDPVAGTMCGYSGSYWGFQLALGSASSWHYSPVGFGAGDCWDRDFESFEGHYCAQHGDVLGFAYGGFGAEPEFFGFDEICDGGGETIKGRNVHEIEITDADPDRLKIKPGERGIIKLRVGNKGDMDERVRVFGLFPEGWSVTAIEFDLARRESVDVTINVTAPRWIDPDIFVAGVKADSGYDDDSKTIVVEILPECGGDGECGGDEYCSFNGVCKRVECERVEDHRCLEGAVEPAPAIGELASGANPNTEDLEDILYDFEPKQLTSLDQSLSIRFYHMENGRQIAFKNMIVSLNRNQMVTDTKGVIEFQPEPGRDYLLEASRLGFKDLAVIFRIPRVEETGELEQVSVGEEEPTGAVSVSDAGDDASFLLVVLALSAIINLVLVSALIYLHRK
jgi:hypothetical protein